MPEKILLTSFRPWLPHQISNSSDDLLLALEASAFPQQQLFFLRQLPVDILPAFQKAIASLEQYQPDGVICCGMAESRQQLTLESNATWQGTRLETQVNLAQLISSLSYTAISHDAGKFVCEGLYYHLLNHLQLSQSPIPCLFVHVPILNHDNFI